ncbi:MAG: TonB-dependent receptor [Candidatus Symbiothrix sp.]|jgi:TonB-linked SusC/RagA family outer membrane protein|nr:TonB-dependent receptor [Candidatus Symbiothrix sp.]
MNVVKKLSNFSSVMLFSVVLTLQWGGVLPLWAESPQDVKIAVSGIVSDVDGPIIGASVVEKGNPSNGASTDLDGKYSLRVPSNATVEVSYLGYATQSIAVNGKTTINVTLSVNAGDLDEFVVVGFQTQKKVNLTGAISTVSAEAFENRPVSNIGQALQGLVPNLNIGISNGNPSTVPSFNIRGGTSMSYNSDDKKYVVDNGSPLILVDGIEFSATMLNQMNPNDIASMSTIKDASAAAIYGTKATFGVILITTKSGKFNQKGKISYSYDLSMDQAVAIPDILNSYTIQKAAMDKNVWTGGSIGSADQTKLDAMKAYMDNPATAPNYYMDGNSIVWVGNMNPYKVVLRDWAPTQKHNLNFSGGSDKVAYYISLGYQNQEGLYKIQTDTYKRYNAAARITAKVTDWFNLEGKLNYNSTNYESPYIVGGKGSIWSAMKGSETAKNINMPIMTGPNDPIPNAYTDNILAWQSYGARTESISNTTTLALSPEFIILPGVLKAKADLSYTPQSSKSTSRRPEHRYVTTSWNGLVAEQGEASNNSAYLSRSTTDTYLINAYLDFNKTFAKKHTVSAILGFSQEKVDYSSQSITLVGLFSPDIMKPAAAEDISLHTSTTGAYTRTGRAGFGRINYNLLDRYLFEVNGRYDGSSRFTPDARFFFFPSFSAGWRISEETFMAGTREYLDNLKLRGSWGKLGSQPGDNYPYQAVMESGAADYFIDGKWLTTVKVPGLVSPTLTWEKAATTNFGIDVTALRNRLSASFDIYERKTTDILTNGVAAYPSVLGASAPLENSGSIKATGWELTINWADRLANGFRYDVGLVLADSRSKVLHYAANPTKSLDALYDGVYVNDIWGYETGGILQESDLTPKYNANGDLTGYDFHGPNQPGSTYWPGYLWYKDSNGDGFINAGSTTLDNPGDRKRLGNSTPRYKYGITGNFGYKDFDLNIFFQGVGKRDLWIGNSAYWGGGAGSQWMYDRSWTPERTNARFPMYTASVPTQSGYMINGAYLRLKQVVLGYTLPQLLTKKAGIEKLRLNLSAYNLFDITDIPSVFDVDQISDSYPLKRTVSIGAQITF